MQSTNLIHLIDLFSDLDPPQTNAIGEHCVWQRYAKGSEVLSHTELSTDVFFIAEGRVSAKRYSSDGKEVAYTEMATGDIFGEFSAIDLERRSASIETLEDSYLARMRAADFRQLIITYPVLGLKLAEHLVRKNRDLTRRVFEFSTMAVSHRIGAELLRMIDPDHDQSEPFNVVPAPSHYQIATKLSTHREAVSRELARLSSMGILDVGRRKIRILDISKLRQLAELDVQ